MSGKKRSPSCQAYYARAKAGKIAEANREKRMRRHAKRAGITYKALIESGAYTAPGSAAHPAARAFDPPRVILNTATRDLTINSCDAFAHSGFVIADGRILEAHPRTDHLHAAFARACAVPRRIVHVFPGGRSQTVAAVTR